MYKHHFVQTSPPIRFLGNHGGFSGAQLYQIDDKPYQFCLRGWPLQQQDRKRLEWIHQVLALSLRRGCDFVANPLTDRNGKTILRAEGRFWQLEPWKPGTADYWSSPSFAKLQSAVAALAAFHNATAEMRSRNQPSQSIQNRIDVLNRLWKNGCATEELRQIESSLTNRSDRLSELGRQIVGHFRTLCQPVGEQLLESASVSCFAQPVIADIWHDHVLFTQSKVTGFVDFGAMRLDSPAGDIARLLGSLVGDDPVTWDRGLAAYEQELEIGPNDKKLVSIFDRSTTLLAGMNWLRWLLLDRIEFESLEPILGRLDRIKSRMECLCTKLRGAELR